MQSSVRMMWPAMIIWCVPDVLHIIFSLSSSSSSQARSSLFCQWLTLYLEKRTVTAGVLARTVCFLGLGLGSLREPQPMGYSISCYLTCCSLSIFLLMAQKLLSSVQGRNSRTVPEAKKMCFHQRSGHHSFLNEDAVSFPFLQLASTIFDTSKICFL